MDIQRIETIIKVWNGRERGRERKKMGKKSKTMRNKYLKRLKSR